MHTLLDGLTLVATSWVIYMLRFKLKDTYQAAQDTVHIYYVVRLSSEPSTFRESSKYTVEYSYQLGMCS